MVHCPCCHGREVRDEPTGIPATGPASVHHTPLFRQLTDDLSHFTHATALTAQAGASAAAGARIDAALGFVAWELHRRHASLLDVRLFRERGPAGGSLTLLVVFGVQAGIAVVLFPSFQAVLGWSGLLSTVAMMPMAVTMMTTSGLASKLTARIGARSTMATGIALAALGLALMALFVSVDGGYLSVLPGLLAMGAGTGLSVTPSTEAVTGSLPRGKQGVASALNDVTREFGTALGVALLGALLSAGYRNAIDDELDALPNGAADTAREGVANAVEAAPGTGPHAQDPLHAARQSFVDGRQQAMWTGVAVMGALFVHVALRGPKSATPAAPSHTAGTSDTVPARWPCRSRATGTRTVRQVPRPRGTCRGPHPDPGAAAAVMHGWRSFRTRKHHLPPTRGPGTSPTGGTPAPAASAPGSRASSTHWAPAESRRCGTAGRRPLRSSPDRCTRTSRGTGCPSPLRRSTRSRNTRVSS
ncbi:hypothetical protein SUDANB126_00121 [Streptomyces sp. enrichment culture]